MTNALSGQRHGIYCNLSESMLVQFHTRVNSLLIYDMLTFFVLSLLFYINSTNLSSCGHECFGYKTMWGKASFSMILESTKFHGLLGSKPEVLLDLQKASSECIDKYFGHISLFLNRGSFCSTKPYAIFQNLIKGHQPRYITMN